MADETFKIGDVVQLKSGGPKMTVTNIVSSGNLSCHWFAEQVKASTDVFPPAALMRPKPASMPMPSGSPIHGGEF